MLILFSFKWANNILQMLLLWLDSIVYFFVSIIYQLFIYLSTARIFEDSFFADFANRIYAILGVFMLFYLAYALLNALVDPEKLAKGDKSVAKLAQNLIISLVLLGLLPSVFTYAYRLQNYILSSNLIGALIMGTKPNDINDNNQAMITFGDTLSFTVLNAFINPTNENVNMSTNYNWYDFKKSVLENSDYSSLPALSDAVVYGAPVAGSGSGEKVNVKYYAFISTAVGCYLIYVLLSFTLDLGVRIIKLAFCQLIAPIPIIMRAMPSKKGTFDKWLKLTISVYFEVFIRVGIMYMSVYFIKALADNQIITNFVADGVMGMFALVVVILGIFTFAKQAPKLISETLGIDSANLKLGIGEKLKAGGFFAGGAMMGAGLTGLTRNAFSNIKKIGGNLKDSHEDWTNANGFWNKAKVVGKGALKFGAGTAVGFGSAIAGGTSGIYNAYKPGKDAKGFGDLKNAAKEGAKASTVNREKRASYIASHGGVAGASLGHFNDSIDVVKEWAGLELSTEALQQQVQTFTKGEDFKKALEEIAKRKSDEAKLYDEQVTALNSSVIKPEEFTKNVITTEYDPVTKQINQVTRKVQDQDAYYKALEDRASQIKDLKNKRDIAIAKQVVKMSNDLDNNLDMKAIVNEFETYKKQNAGVESIEGLEHLVNMDWDDAWDNDASLMKKNLAYLKNNSSMKEEKNKATAQLNERIIKEQEKKK